MQQMSVCSLSDSILSYSLDRGKVDLDLELTSKPVMSLGR